MTGLQDEGRATLPWPRAALGALGCGGEQGPGARQADTRASVRPAEVRRATSVLSSATGLPPSLRGSEQGVPLGRVPAPGCHRDLTGEMCWPCPGFLNRSPRRVHEHTHTCIHTNTHVYTHTGVYTHMHTQTHTLRCQDSACSHEELQTQSAHSFSLPVV